MTVSTFPGTLLLFSLFYSNIFPVCQGQGCPNTRGKYPNISFPEDYDNQIPDYDFGDPNASPVQVQIDTSIAEIFEVNDEDSDLTIQLAMILVWRDFRQA